MKKLGAVGDVNPIEYGGGFVFGAPGQDPWIEYTYGLESEAPKGVRLNDTRVDTWFERDRANVALYAVTPEDENALIVEWWDDDVQQAVTDGFLNPRNWHGSAFEYAKDRGLLEGFERLQVYREEIPRDVFAYNDWADVEDVAATTGQDPDKLLAAGKSRKIMDRVYALECIAGHYGWDELDQYPLTLTAKELERRWGL
jgi:hypothetical protein